MIHAARQTAADSPPSKLIAAPVMYAARSEQRKATRSANSCASPNRPSGTGVQLSLYGLGGVAVGWDEGIELNFLTLNFGVDLTRPALKLPVLGRLGAS